MLGLYQPIHAALQDIALLLQLPSQFFIALTQQTVGIIAQALLQCRQLHLQLGGLFG